MTGPLEHTQKGPLVSIAPTRPADENPALVYVASLTTGDGRRSMRQSLEKIAHILSGGRAAGT